MWLFKSKKKETEQIWNALQGVPDPNAIPKMINQIKLGNTDEVEKILKKHMADKVREFERNACKN